MEPATWKTHEKIKVPDESIVPFQSTFESVDALQNLSVEVGFSSWISNDNLDQII